MTKNILITGITGFVGSHLAELILEKKYTVYGLRRWHLSKMRNVQKIMDQIEWIDCDITDPISVKNALKISNPEKIFHLGAESFVSPSWNHPSHYMDVNYKGTVNILESMRELEMKSRILIPGSGEEYGEIHENELPISENSILRPVNPYAVTKIAQDLIASVYFRSYGINVVRVRSFNHEGPRRDKVFGIPSFAYQIARIEQGLQEPIIKTGHTGDKRNFTHIRDLVEAYWVAIEKCNPGELYLIGSDETEKIYTYREIIDKLISLSDIGKISVKQVPEYTRPTAVPRLIGNTSKFRNLTGWKPKISVDKILEDTLEYWRDFVKNNHY